MPTVPKPPPGGERTDPPSFRLDDPALICAWLAGLREHVLDAVYGRPSGRRSG